MRPCTFRWIYEYWNLYHYYCYSVWHFYWVRNPPILMEILQFTCSHIRPLRNIFDALVFLRCSLMPPLSSIIVEQVPWCHYSGCCLWTMIKVILYEALSLSVKYTNIETCSITIFSPFDTSIGCGNHFIFLEVWHPAVEDIHTHTNISLKNVAL